MSKVMVITGGSRGIGASCARLAAQRGYDVVVAYAENREAVEAVGHEVEAAGATALVHQCDVANEEDIIELFDAACELGALEAVIANAGIIDVRARLDEMSVARMERIMAVNVVGTMVTCREAVRRMSTRHGGDGGAIVINSSVASRIGSPNEFIDYAVSKGGMDTLTIGLSKEVAQEGIRVNAVRPGLIYTDIHADAGVPDRVDELVGGVPMARGGSAAEVAEAILWLASDASSYITGALLDVTGGR